MCVDVGGYVVVIVVQCVLVSMCGFVFRIVVMFCLFCFCLGLLVFVFILLVVVMLVLLIFIDGLCLVDVLYVKVCGLVLFNFMCFVCEGVYVEGVIGVLFMFIYFSYVILFIGVLLCVYGVGGNFSFDLYNKNQFGWDWYVSDIKVFMLWQVVYDVGFFIVNVYWLVSVGVVGVDWNLLQIWCIGIEDDCKLFVVLVMFGLLLVLEKDLGLYLQGINEEFDGDQVCVCFVVKLFELYWLQFMIVYFVVFDYEEYVKGLGMFDVNCVFEQIDVLVGEVVDVVCCVYLDGVVVVVFDYGFVLVMQDVNLYVLFFKEGLVMLKDGVIIDWQVVVWNDGGSVVIVLCDFFDVVVKVCVQVLFEWLCQDLVYGIVEIFDCWQLLVKGGSDKVSWFVVFKFGYELGVIFDVLLLVFLYYYGMYGYDFVCFDQCVILLIVGKDVLVGCDFGVVDMCDIVFMLVGYFGVVLFMV